MIFGGVSTASSCLVSAGSLMSYLSAGDPGQIIATAWSVVGIVFNALIVFAGFKMKSLQMYPLAIAGAVFCCLPFCSGFCCVVVHLSSPQARLRRADRSRSPRTISVAIPPGRLSAITAQRDQSSRVSRAAVSSSRVNQVSGTAATR